MKNCKNNICPALGSRRGQSIRKLGQELTNNRPMHEDLVMYSQNYKHIGR